MPIVNTSIQFIKDPALSLWNFVVGSAQTIVFKPKNTPLVRVKGNGELKNL